MARLKKIDRPVLFRAYLPESIHSKLELELYSELEGRVPHGKQSELMTELVSQWLVSRGVVI